MNLPTIVEEYVVAGIKHAVFERSDDGTVSAYVQELPGVVAFGADICECARNLHGHIEEWARTALLEGYPLPVLEGIDLNTRTARILAANHLDPESTGIQGTFFPDESALDMTFRHIDDTADLRE